MRLEFHRPDSPNDVLATATWDGRRAVTEAADDEVRATLDRIFRSTPVAVDDAAYRRLGTSGAVVLQPGTVEWFRAAASVRAESAGLVARVVSDVHEGGWDPAAQYRTFTESLRRYS